MKKISLKEESWQIYSWEEDSLLASQWIPSVIVSVTAICYRQTFEKPWVNPNWWV